MTAAIAWLGATVPGRSRELLHRITTEKQWLVRAAWPEFDPAWRVTEWMASGIARSGYVTPGHLRSFRIGNAAGAVDPIGGEGIGLALWAGERLGQMLGGLGELDGPRLADIQGAFASEYRARLRWRRLVCRMTAEVLVRPRVVRVLRPFVGVRGAMGLWYRLSGKQGEGRQVVEPGGLGA